MKDYIYSLQVLVKQEGSCETPIMLWCSKCALMEICNKEKEVCKEFILRSARELLEDLSEDLIFDIVL